MRLGHVRFGEHHRIGVVEADHSHVRVLPASVGKVDDVVRGGPEALEAVRRACKSTDPVPLSTVTLGSPLLRYNRDILCVGWNYTDHFYESSGKRGGQDLDAPPEHPTFFGKSPLTALGPNDDIDFDSSLSDRWDWEAEIALIIGTPGRSIAEDSAMSHVFGFAVANDVTLRDVQRAHGGQWLKGKSIDRTMPLGPWITTPDDVENQTDLLIECMVNDQVMQKASTADMVYTFARLIAELSAGMTLLAGDVILTGTPSGIGNAREPAVFLHPGDQLVTRVHGLGTLTNEVVPVR